MSGFTINNNIEKYSENSDTPEVPESKRRESEVRRSIEDKRIAKENAREEWDALAETTEESAMNMKELKHEIKEILKFEGLPLTNKEIKQRFEDEGTTLNDKQFMNALQLMKASGEILAIKVLKEPVRYGLKKEALPLSATVQTKPEPESKPNQETESAAVQPKQEYPTPETASVPDEEPKPDQETQSVTDDMQESELLEKYMAKIKGTAKYLVFDGLDEAKDWAYNQTLDNGYTIDIHQIFTKPIGTYQPVPEFKPATNNA